MENNYNLFSGIKDIEFNKIMNCFEREEKEYKAGDVILDFSKSNTKVGIIEDGSAIMVRIDVDGNKTILETLNRNNIFGESIAFSGNKRDSIFVECVKDCKVFFIEYEHITRRCENVCGHHTLLIQNMFKIISNKLIDMSNRVEVLSNRTIRQKLLCYFNICAIKEKDNTFEIPFSMSDLADFIAADRSAMMREIKNMKEEGIILSDKRKIVIL